MAVRIGELDTAVRQRHRANVVQNAFQHSPLWKKVWGNKSTEDGGTAIVQPITHPVANDTAHFDGVFGLLPTVQTANIDSALFPWRDTVVPVAIANGDLDRAKGKEKVLDIMDERFDKATEDFNEQMSNEMYDHNAGGTGQAIDGFRLSIDDGTGAGGRYAASVNYGGISRTAQAWWQGQTFLNGGVGRALTMALLRQAYRATVFRSMPDMMFTSLNVQHKTLSIYDGQKFITREELSAGFEVMKIEVDGIPMFFDELAPTDSATQHMIFILTVGKGSQKYIDFTCLANRVFKWGGFKEPIDQDAKVGHFFLTGNLNVASPRRQGIIYDINPTL